MLQISKVSKQYRGGPLALKSVGLQIDKGVFGLLGPNGAGKTTLMRIIATRLMPTEGDVNFNGINILSEPMKIRELLGYLPQEFGLYEDLRVQEFLEYIVLLKGFYSSAEKKNETERVMQITRIVEKRTDRIKSLSGGMKKRVGVAQALIGNPKLLILDEPTAGLDPEEKNRFYAILAALSLDAVVILSTHIVSDIERLAQKMAIINEGNILWNGDPKDLQEEIKDKTYEGVVSEEKLVAIKEKASVIFEVSQPEGIKVRTVGTDGLNESGLSQVNPTLEDAYLWLMGGKK